MPMRSTARIGGGRERERLRLGVADVLGGEDHQPARQEERVLAGREHARGVVERGVRVAGAQALDQRRDDVVVLLAVAVVQQQRAAGRLAHRPRARAARRARPARRWSAAAVSSRPSARRASPSAACGDRGAASSPSTGALRAEARARGPRPRAAAAPRAPARSSRASVNTRQRESSGAITSKEGFSVVAPISVTVPASTCGSSASCCARFKRWISSRKSTRAHAAPPLAARRLDRLADLLHARRHRGERLEARAGRVASRRASVVLPAAGRTPEDQRGQLAGLDERAQGGAGAAAARPGPTTSSSARGRMRSASGARGSRPRRAPARRTARAIVGGHARSLATWECIPAARCSVCDAGSAICVKPEQPQLADIVARARRVAARARIEVVLDPEAARWAGAPGRRATSWRRASIWSSCSAATARCSRWRARSASGRCRSSA